LGILRNNLVAESSIYLTCIEAPSVGGTQSVTNGRQTYWRLGHAGLCCSGLQCIFECCSVMQGVAMCCSTYVCCCDKCSVLQCVAACCSVLLRVAMCCSVLLCVAMHCSTYVCCSDNCNGVENFLKFDHECFFCVCERRQSDRVSERVWLCPFDTSRGQMTVRSKPHLCMLCLCCSVLQCVAVCCSVLQWHVWRSNDCEKQATPIHVVFVLQCIAVCYSVLQCVAVTCLEVKWLWEASHTYACCLYGLDSVFVAEYLCPCVRERAREWACVCACIPLGEKERNHQWERQKERVRETIFFPRNCSFNHAFFNALWMGAGIWDQRIKHTHTPITRTKLGHDPIVQYWDMTPWILKRERILTQI